MFERIRKLLSPRRAEAPAPPAPPAVPPAKPAPPEWQRLGNAALASGQLPQAALHYREGTSDPVKAAVAWINLAYVQLELGQREEARVSLQAAQDRLPAADPALVDVFSLQGRERQESGDWAAAAEAYRRALAIQPSSEFAWRELAQVCEMQGDEAEAEACLQRALAARGDFDLALRDLARLMLKRQRPAEALAWLDRLDAVQPADADARLMRADALRAANRLPEALAAIDQLLALVAEPRAMTLRGAILHQMHRPEEAIAWHAKALQAKPDLVGALVSSSAPLVHLHQYDEALTRLDRALALSPGEPDALLNKGHLLLKLQRCQEALATFEEHLGRHPPHPEARFGAAIALLLLGDFQRGWAAYESRWELSHNGVPNRKPKFGVPEWSGEPLAGKSLLIYAEQGLGDTIQMLRFVPGLAAQAAQVWLLVQPPLYPLLGSLPSNCQVLPAGQPLPPLDLVCPILSLPRVLGADERTMPREVPYILAPDERVAHWRQRLGPARGLRVGLVWSGNPQHGNDHNRSVALAEVMAHVTPGLELISLQKEVPSRDQAALQASTALRHFGDDIESFGDTAAIASLVDVVISVDTSVAHLAGSLGRPLLLLLPYAPDWRWMLDRDDTPWYPTARLFRQTTAGDWAAPLAAAMAEALARRVSAAPAST